MCAKCTTTVPFCDAGFLARASVEWHIKRLAARIGAPLAVHVCDDPERWDWRAFVATRA